MVQLQGVIHHVVLGWLSVLRIHWSVWNFSCRPTHADADQPDDRPLRIVTWLLVPLALAVGTLLLWIMAGLGVFMGLPLSEDGSIACNGR